jgi:2-C-methyl-D-erythritol 4-phosphate cytidylyltransferase
VSTPRVGAVIPAAGKGTRIGGERPKQFIELEGKSLLLHVLEYIESTSLIDVAILVTGAEHKQEATDLISRHHLSKIKDVVGGGIERQDSVWNGLQRLKDEQVEYVAVHDAVRPFLEDELFRRVLRAAMDFGAAVPAVRPKETIKQATTDLFVAMTPPRVDLWLIQTPQIFEVSLLYRAYRSAMANGYYGTDDASLVEKIGEKVKIVEGSYDNIKITTPEDFDMAQLIRQRRR